MVWGIRWDRFNRLDGHTTNLMGGHHFGQPPVQFRGNTRYLFQTRREARAFIKYHYSYMKRPDLRAEPHGWRMPRPVQVVVTVTEEGT